MTFVLSTLAVAFAAFCVWLTVRIVNRRERWEMWMLAAVVGLPLFYVASAGPACWWLTKSSCDRTGRSTMRYAPRIYWPRPPGLRPAAGNDPRRDHQQYVVQLHVD